MVASIRSRNTALRRLPAEQLMSIRFGGRHRLSNVYRRADLVMLGFGVMIGAGIFKIAGAEAAATAGPGVIFSFLIAGAACLLAALGYAELSSVMPVAGSAYSFTYVIFGELWAWVIGWSMLLEMLLAASVVSRAWSIYATQALSDSGVALPKMLASIAGKPNGFDLFALAILVFLIAVVALGARLGLRLLWLMVLAKLAVIILVIAIGAGSVHRSNYSPLIPPARPVSSSGSSTILQIVSGHGSSAFGIFGVFAAAATIAFGYLGFDLIATSAEETHEARRDVPRAIVASLVITIVLYVGVAVVMTGMVRYNKLNPDAPLAGAFSAAGAPVMVHVIDIGAVLGLTTVILVVLIASTRVLFSMARDGLLPPGLAEVGRSTKVPTRATLAVGTVAVIMSQALDVITLQQIVVIGTLIAFAFVLAGVLVLRRTRPDLPRGFRIPGVWVVGLVGVIATIWLMLNLSLRTWEYYLIWTAIGLICYVGYGRLTSHLGKQLAAEGAPAQPGDQVLVSPAEIAGESWPPAAAPLPSPTRPGVGVPGQPGRPLGPLWPGAPGEPPWFGGAAHRPYLSDTGRGPRRGGDLTDDVAFRLMASTFVTLFWRPALLAGTTEWLLAHGYEVVCLDASRWTAESDVHRDLAAALRFPSHYGRNLDALNDCLRDVASYKYGSSPQAAGLVLVLTGYDKFTVHCPRAAQAVLDIFAGQARSAALIGHRMLCLVQSDNPNIRFAPVGAMPVMWNEAEWLDPTFRPE